MPWAVAAAGVSAAGSLASSGKGKKGAKSAAGQQQQALGQAIGTYQNMFGQAAQTAAPFINAGQNAEGQLMQRLPDLTKPFGMTEADLQQTPGYQFALNQGLKAMQNGFAAKGLASSGAAMGGAGQFATGLADQTYGNQFNRYWDQNKAIASLLGLPISQGLQAEGQLFPLIGDFGKMIGGAQTGVGNAGAAGTLGAAGQGQNGIGGVTGALNQLFTKDPNTGQYPLSGLFASSPPATTGAGTPSDTSTFV